MDLQVGEGLIARPLALPPPSCVTQGAHVYLSHTCLLRVSRCLVVGVLRQLIRRDTLEDEEVDFLGGLLFRVGGRDLADDENGEDPDHAE